MNYLYAAYIITWVILIGYIAMLARGFKRLQEEMRDLER
jgi:CcmD family protein